MRATASHYSAVAIVLHWAIAIALLGNLVLGWWMHEALEDGATRAFAVNAFQVHKSLGLAVVVLSVLRLAWRLLNPPPPLPAAMPRWERAAAHATHGLFYVLMFAVPLSGWLYVSAQWRGEAALNVPTLWFGLFEVPHLFGLDGASAAFRQEFSGIAIEAHEWLAWSTGLLFLLHVGAALKHHFVERDAVLARMIPCAAREPYPGRNCEGGLRFGAVLIAVGVIAVAFALFNPVAGTRPVQAGDIRASEGGWWVDAQASHVRFSGTHAGSPFEGRFTRWIADLRIDAAAPQASRIAARIDTASATDGVTLHEQTLPESEWFDVANHPEAHYEATSITPLDDGGYRVDGLLRIKQRPIPVNGLRLEVEEDQARLRGVAEISRADADLGMESDPGAEWVSAVIRVEVNVVASPR